MKTETESYFKSHDQHRLYYRHYKAAAPHSILVFVHGINEHSGRYENPVRYFAKKHDIFLFDQRGFGRSDGVRSHVESFHQYSRDLDEFIRMIHRQNKKMKIYVVGHSMGGQVVVNYAANYPESPVAGYILSSPNIRVAIKINPIKKWAGINLAKMLPKLRLGSDLNESLISRDKEVVSAYKKDPLVRSDLTCRLASEILKNQDEIMGLADKIKKPILMMHAGDDRICSPEATEKFFEQIPHAKKTLKIYEGMYHEIFNEFGKEDVFRDMELWLASQK